MKKKNRILALILAIVLLVTAIVPAMYITAQDSIETKVKEAFISYVESVGNEATYDGLKAAVEAAVGEDLKVTLTRGNFYIKHAVDGVVDEDPDPATKIDIKGYDGAIAALIKVGDETFGLTTVIKHKVENLGVLTVPVLGDYDSGDGTRIINWIGNGDPNKKYKIIVPANASHINTNGLKFEGENAENVVAMVILGHSNNYGWDVPRYGKKFTHLKAVKMADSIISFTPDNAFSGCQYLKYVHLSDSLVGAYPAYMFKDCVSLENINFPDRMTRVVEEQAFYNTGLREIILPTEDITLGKEAFGSQAFTNGTRNIVYLDAKLDWAQAAAYACEAINSSEYTARTTAADIENIAKSVWTSNINYTLSWPNGWDSDMSDNEFGGTLRLTKSSRVYDIEFTGYFDILSDENRLSKLGVRYLEFTPEFSPNVYEYSLTVPNSITDLEITTETMHLMAEVDTIVGATNLPAGESQVVIPVVSQSGKILEYKINLTRSGEADPNDTPINRFLAASNGVKVEADANEVDFKFALSEVVRDDNYKVEISNYYKLDAIEGAKDQYGIVVPAYDGYIVAYAALIDKATNEPVAAGNVIATVKGGYHTYEVDSVSTAGDFKLSDDGKTLLAYTGTAEKVVIPEGVEKIDELYMEGEPSKIKILVLPDSLGATPAAMCWGMSHLEACYMGDRVTYLSNNEFKDCYKLRYVRLSEQIEQTTYGMFMHTFALADLHLPVSVKTIGNQTFFNGFIRNITLSGNVEKIWEDAFGWLSHNPDRFRGGNGWGIKIPDDIIADIKELILNDKSRPVNINILSEDVEFTERGSFETDDSGAWSKITLIAPENSTVKAHYDAKEYKGVNFVNCNMSIGEAVARSMRTLNTMFLSNKTSELLIEKNLEASYYSSNIKELTWAEELKVTPATETKDGNASGVIVLKDVDGNEYKLVLNRDFPLVTEYIEQEEIEEDLEEDFEEELEEDLEEEFFEEELEEEFFEDIVVETEPEEEIVEEEEEETSNSKTYIVKRKKKKASSSALAPWVLPVIIAAAVVVAAAVAVIIILIVKKRKKKNT